jgi:hypothetical protein
MLLSSRETPYSRKDMDVRTYESQSYAAYAHTYNLEPGSATGLTS